MQRASVRTHARLAGGLLAAALLLRALPAPAAPVWPRETLQAGGRALAVAMGPGQGDVLTVVIEGDGRAFDSRGRPTADPTPGTATGYALARAWPGGPVAWLGRLCQYVRADDPRCTQADWTGARFGDQAIDAANAAIDALEKRAGARRVVLAGWSGGGVLAVLTAERRSDVAGIVTIAAPLDLETWTRWRNLAPLAASRDPAKTRFDGIPPPQVHLLGAFDTIVPAPAAAAAAGRLAGRADAVIVVPERHDCCWARRIPQALSRLAAQAASPDP